MVSDDQLESYVLAKKANPKYKICLNMIVKNESKVISRLIETVKDVIDYYIISDTGSTDNTVNQIKKTMKKFGIPGKIFHDQWKNFAHNRQKALTYVYQQPDCKYAMIIDADEQFKTGLDSTKKVKSDYFNKYNLDCYHIKRKYLGNEYYLPFLLDTTKVIWHWKGPVHNYIDLKENYGKAEHQYIGDEIVYIHVNYHEGSKSAGVSAKEKYMRDVKLLTNELEENPDDTRSWFYLGQSYYDADEFEEAYQAYKHRSEMGGWNEEVFYSLYRMGCCLIALNRPYQDILDQMLKTYEYHPTRIEPLYELTKYCREKKKYHQGFMFGRMALELNQHTDVLFIHKALYDYALFDQYALCAYYTGRYEICRDVMIKLLKEKKYPDGYEKRYKDNLRFALTAIQKKMEKC